MTDAELRHMCEHLQHRGPDDSGVESFQAAGFGHRRLSIVDLSKGHQPMSNEDGSIWITYNGEVYNHLEHRSLLVAHGHRYRSRSDTETIIHLYEEFGEEFLSRLRGMFALAIWDGRSDSLLLARDRLGIKPLYYALTQKGDIVFASEIKAIFASGLVEPEIDSTSLPEYFATGHVAGRRTLYRHVQKLEPGHMALWRGGRIHVSRYWNILDPPGSDAEAPVERDTAAGAEAFWNLFVESVRLRLMSDVPLGVFLSGGLDSSLIVAAMRETGVDRLVTFSVGFEEPSANELPYARLVADAFGTDHREVLLSPDDFFGALPRLTWHRDMPLTFPASIPLYFVSQLAQDHVKVVLTGEGGDELFAGYGRYLRGLWNLRLGQMMDSWLPRNARAALSRALGRLGDGYVASRAKRSFLARSGGFENLYLEPFAYFNSAQRSQLLSLSGSEDAYTNCRQYLDEGLLEANTLEAILRFDQATYLQELLEKQDRMSMAASIESRVPYLDHPLVSWSARLPGQLKLNRGRGKAIVRDVGRQKLPRAVVNARKRGFPVPLRKWFMGMGRTWIEEYTPQDGDEFIRRSYVERLLAQHFQGHDHTNRLWLLLAFQVWRREVPARATGSSPVASSSTLQVSPNVSRS